MMPMKRVGVPTSLLTRELASVLGLRLFPPHVRERGSDTRRIAFFEKPNLDSIRNFTVQHFMPKRAGF